MKCFNCANEIADGSVFCPICGAQQPAQAPVPPQTAPVYEGPTPTPQAPVQPVAPQPQQGFSQQAPQQGEYYDPTQAPAYQTYNTPQMPLTPAPKKKSKLPVIIGSVVAVIAILVIIGIVFGGSSIESGELDGQTYTNESAKLMFEAPDEFSIYEPGKAELDRLLDENEDATGSIEKDDNGDYYYTEEDTESRQYYEFSAEFNGENTSSVSNAAVDLYRYDKGSSSFYNDGELLKIFEEDIEEANDELSELGIELEKGKEYKKTIGGNEYTCYDYSAETEYYGYTVNVSAVIAIYSSGDDAMVIEACSIVMGDPDKSYTTEDLLDMFSECK